MKNLLVKDIEHYVKAKLDELSNNEDAMLVADDQAVSDLDKQILAAAIPAIRKIHLDAPNVLLKDGESLMKCPIYSSLTEKSSHLEAEPTIIYFPPEGGEINVNIRTIEDWSVSVEEEIDIVFNEALYKYYILLPSDFLRLITLQLADWQRPIVTLVTEDSAEYRKQQNKYLRGTPRKPVGALVHRNGMPPVAELFSGSTNQATMLYGQCILEPKIKNNPQTNEDYIDVCEPLYYPCLNQITADVLRSIGEVQKAMIYDQLAVQPFYIDPEYSRLNPLSGERINAQIKQQ